MKSPWTELIKAAFPPAADPMAIAVPAKPPEDGRLLAPKTREELRVWCAKWLEVRLPEKPVCPQHNTPLDYLDYVFFERGDADPLVWACRGGGKTLLGAVATLLDMLFKPGVEIRILGGSQAQSERMYEHLVRMTQRRFCDQLAGNGRQSRITKSGFAFSNGSRVELLGQSETSVRGARVQKVRCDEVDLFDPKVWEAVQLTTLSKGLQSARDRGLEPQPGGKQMRIRGAVEAFSTMNTGSGLMAKLVREQKRKLFTWCVWDVVEKCIDKCELCILHRDCQEKAHGAEGFVPVADLRTMRGRVGDSTWRLEILCDHVGASGYRGVQVIHY